MADLRNYKTSLIVSACLLLLLLSMYLCPYNNNRYFIANTDLFSIPPLSASSSSTIGEDNGILTQKKLTSLGRIEDDLARARAAIRTAARTRNYTSNKVQGFVPRGPIFRNPYAFHQLRFLS
ncbi:hypothetical protein C5167_014385 [Papaver somniferum]|uniref:Uncharacterized protein n=1 Tax=Papaver somniferum TaxID=3469 RepID=A0A4Y7J715_PAPSO|nr:hypothetical protein C5167_014385 [Papaver somniferum]